MAPPRKRRFGEGARISAEARPQAALAVDMLSVTVRDHGSSWTWQGSDFQTVRPTPTTDEHETGTSGTAEATFQLAAEGQALSEGTISLPLQRDWRWSVTIMARTSDPRVECFGCVGSKAFPLAASHRQPDRDSIWVVWGGNSISDPVTY